MEPAVDDFWLESGGLEVASTGPTLRAKLVEFPLQPVAGCKAGGVPPSLASVVGVEPRTALDLRPTGR